MPNETLQERLERLRRQVRAQCEQVVPATTRRVIWADDALQRLRAYADRLTVPLALVAGPIVRGRMWQVFGCARAEDHCRERYGRGARWLRNLAALGRGLDTLPGLERAITGEDGAQPIGRTFAVHLTKIASPESAAAWIGLARTLSIREFESAVRRARHAGSAWPVAAEPPQQAECASTPSGARDEVDCHDVDRVAGLTTLAAGTGNAFDAEPGVDERTPLTEVRMDVPGPFRVAFDDGLNLHRAVSGSEVPVSDFIEALVAESMNGPLRVRVADAGLGGDDDGAMGAAGSAGDFDVERLRLRRGSSVASAERALARETDHWRALDRGQPSPPLDARPRDRKFERLCRTTTRLLEQLETVTTAAVPGTPAALNRRLCELVGLENRVERQMGRLLDYMSAKDAWRRLHFDSLAHYGAERLAMARRTAEDRARATRVLKALPLVRASYEADRIGLEKALLVARALGPGPVNRSTEAAWVRRAEESSVKRLRDEVRVASREWLLHDSWKPRGPLDDDEWRRSIALFPGTTRRRFERLVGVAGSSRMRDSVTSLRFRLVEPAADDFLTTVETCRSRLAAFARTFSVEGAATAAVPALAVADDNVARLPTGSARDDATAAARMLSSDVGAVVGLPAGFARDDAASVARTLSADMLVAAVAHTPLAARTALLFHAQGREVPSWVGLMALLEGYIATWDPPETGLPARYATIYQRDGYRCMSPLCTSRRNLHAHHGKRRSQGGGDDPSNLITLCAFCHQRGIHGGLASMSGKAPLNNMFRLGREDVGECYLNERRIRAPDAMAS